MIKALVDTNVIIDFFLGREPFCRNAEIVFQKMNSSECEGYVSASAVTDIFYLLQKAKGHFKAKEDLLELIKVLDILEVNKNTVITALLFDWKDFEDAVQAQVAIENGLDVIITRNPQDYRNLEILQVLTPSNLAEKY